MSAELIAFICYSLVLLGLIYSKGFFGLFNDTAICRKTFSILFAGKLLAVPAFLFIYTRIYGGIDDFDTGKFYHDVKALFNYGKSDPGFLFRVLFGLQDDLKGSADYEHVLKNTLNWDNGTVKDYLYNDNRVVIRVHLLLNFLAFNFYSVHALFNCFLSFIGLYFIYKTFKGWFKGKELVALMILCFFSALWFYTGALLKEGIVVFVLGCQLYQLKHLVNGQLKAPGILWLLCLLYISLLLKPYLLVFAAICFSVFFFLERTNRLKRKTLAFLVLIGFSVILVNAASLVLKDCSLADAALKHQRRFVGVSKGGIFLGGEKQFLRLNNSDSSQVQAVADKKGFYTIRPHAKYMYWRTLDQSDTLYCNDNQDTLTAYELAYIIQPGQSNIQLPTGNVLYTLAGCLYYTLFYPTFLNARNALQLLAALENLFILAALLIIVYGCIRSPKEKLLPTVFLVFALALCLLIGITAPNSGAIFRYRSPAMLFLLLAALYFLPCFKKEVSSLESEAGRLSS